jgi:hypothetical protein
MVVGYRLRHDHNKEVDVVLMMNRGQNGEHSNSRNFHLGYSFNLDFGAKDKPETDQRQGSVRQEEHRVETYPIQVAGQYQPLQPTRRDIEEHYQASRPPEQRASIDEEDFRRIVEDVLRDLQREQQRNDGRGDGNLDLTKQGGTQRTEKARV